MIPVMGRPAHALNYEWVLANGVWIDLTTAQQREVEEYARAVHESCGSPSQNRWNEQATWKGKAGWLETNGMGKAGEIAVSVACGGRSMSVAGHRQKSDEPDNIIHDGRGFETKTRGKREYFWLERSTATDQKMAPKVILPVIFVLAFPKRVNDLSSLVVAGYAPAERIYARWFSSSDGPAVRAHETFFYISDLQP